MARVSTYLIFAGTTEAAFSFYKSVFQTEYVTPIVRFDSAPPNPAAPLQEADKQMVLHVALPILGGHLLMGSDCPPSSGMSVTPGNAVHINLEPDTRAETKRLFDALSAGGKVEMELQDMFWGDYYGSFEDRFGVHWMVNCRSKA
ncbi:MAG TPA: VOC family protein [Opitutus sp.]|nr:VOC family protein [Opitutus sp.]